MVEEILEEEEALNFSHAKIQGTFAQVHSFRYETVNRAGDYLLAIVGLFPCALIGIPVAALIQCT